jgi:phage virion morphogenesis protein
MDFTVQSNADQVVISLEKLELGLQDRRALLRTIGAGQLVSVRKTFSEQGSPSGSWAPLSPNTVKRNPKKYGAGHKLLIDKSILLNSIHADVQQDAVVIGTNVPYAAVHQFGSRDRGAAIGPQARIAGRSVEVEAHGRDGRRRRGQVAITNKLGRQQTVTRMMEGPVELVKVRTHQRFQNIPARPYLVILPEDPARIGDEVWIFIAQRKKEAGL